MLIFSLLTQIQLAAACRHAQCLCLIVWLKNTQALGQSNISYKGINVSMQEESQTMDPPESEKSDVIAVIVTKTKTPLSKPKNLVNRTKLKP